MRLMETVGEAVGKAGATPKKTVPWDVSWSRFAGHYSSPSGELEVVELNQRLVMIDPELETLSAEQRLEPLGNGLFRLEAPAGGGAAGETVRFTLDIASQGLSVEEAKANLTEAVGLFLATADDAEIQQRLKSEVFFTHVEVPVG